MRKDWESNTLYSEKAESGEVLLGRKAQTWHPGL